MASEGGDVEIVSYTREYSRETFDCGKPELDGWLKQQATQQQKTGNTRTFLAISVDADRVVGYYSTTTYRLELDDAAAAYGAGRRRYPVPAVLLARLAVDQEFQGTGLGARLLAHAVQQLALASRSVGFEVIVVDAIDPEAVTFYAKAGFIRFEDHSLRLFLPMKHVLATVGDA